MHAINSIPARRLSTLSLFMFLGLTLGGCSDGTQARRPNVLLITLDTTRADYLSSYGNPDRPTPHLDALAAAGTRFELALSSASVTPVAHASILTGRLNQEHGLRVLTAQGGYRLEQDVPSLATLLKAEGYGTAAIHSAFPVSSYFGFAHGFDHFDDLDADLEVKEGEFASWDVANHQRRSDETSDRVIEYLASAEGPFFLWIHYWDPHDGKQRPPASTARGQLALYAEEVEYMDAQIGRMLSALDANGQAQETMVVVVSDHGQGLGDHGWAGHRILYQEDIRVPLLMRIPGHDQKPVVEDLVSTIDILPTLLDYIGVGVPPGVSGASLRGLMEGVSEPGRVAYSDQINRFDENAAMIEDRPLDDFLYCAMDRQWKLIYRPTNPEQSELFDIQADPGELKNRYASEPAQVQRLLRLLGERAPWVLQAPEPIEDDERAGALDALSALGYAEGQAEVQPLGFEWEWVCPDPAHSGTHPMSKSKGCPQCAAPLVPRRKR